jgi:hypothetical protein
VINRAQSIVASACMLAVLQPSAPCDVIYYVWCAGTLYLPPGYSVEKDGPLPTILWAYVSVCDRLALLGTSSTTMHEYTCSRSASLHADQPAHVQQVLAHQL